MEGSRGDLFIDVVVERRIFKLHSPPVSPSYLKQVWDYQKQGLVFGVLLNVTQATSPAQLDLREQTSFRSTTEMLIP